LAADIDGDSRLDLASVSNYGGTGVSVLLGNGDGTFQPARHSGLGYNSAPLIGDLNSDAISDQVKITDSDLRVLLGNADGTYQQTQAIVLPSQLPAGAGRYPVQMPTSAQLGDLNGDGKLDLVAAGFDEQVVYVSGWAAIRQDFYVNVLLGNGDGTFGQVANYYVNSATYDANSVRAYGFVLGVRDFDGDGKSDVLMMSPGGVLFRGNGDGTLQTPPSAYPGAWTTPDVNADGKLDRVDLVYYPNPLYDDPTPRYANVSLGIGGGSFASPVGSDLGPAYNARYLIQKGFADFDGDGFPELVTVETANDLPFGFVCVAHNDGVWTPPPLPLPSIAIGDVTITEGNTGTRAAGLTVTLSATSGQPVTVNYATADFTATAGSDYRATSGTLTFAPGETSKTIWVLVIGDRRAEANEAFVVTLSGETNAILAAIQGAVNIIDDEPRVSISDVTKAEGKKGNITLFTFTASLSTAYDQPVTMSFRTVNGTAKTSDNDYVAKTGTITFAPGETTKTITITVKGDSKREADETFYLDLFGLGSNALLTKNRGTGTILNDD
jgi:hypothetical protein